MSGGGSFAPVAARVMIAAMGLRRLIREYPNTALFALGLLLVAGEEGTSKAVFYAHTAIHFWKWPIPPLIAEVADCWWKAEHTLPYTAAAISVCAIGAILILVAFVRWVRGRPVNRPDP